MNNTWNQIEKKGDNNIVGLYYLILSHRTFPSKYPLISNKKRNDDRKMNKLYGKWNKK